MVRVPGEGQSKVTQRKIKGNSRQLCPGRPLLGAVCMRATLGAAEPPRKDLVPNLYPSLVQGGETQSLQTDPKRG